MSIRTSHADINYNRGGSPLLGSCKAESLLNGIFYSQLCRASPWWTLNSFAQKSSLKHGAVLNFLAMWPCAWALPFSILHIKRKQENTFPLFISESQKQLLIFKLKYTEVMPKLRTCLGKTHHSTIFHQQSYFISLAPPPFIFAKLKS